MIDREKEYILKKLQEALEKAENDGCFLCGDTQTNSF